MKSFRYWTPRYLADRLALAVFEHRNPKLPWITAAMIEILESWLRLSDCGLEFGSGRSTVWFAARVKRLTSVEHDPACYARVLASLRNAGAADRVDYRLQEISQEEGSEAEYVGVAREGSSESLDFCLIDGEHRDQCALAAIDRIRRGGILILDNANWYLPRKSPSRAPNSRRLQDGCASEAWERFQLATVDWRCVWTTNGVTDTALYVKP